MDGLQNDGGIKREREITDIIEVVFQLSQCVGDVRSIPIIDLRPTCDSGLNEVPKILAGNFALVLGHQTVPFRSRAY